MFAKLILTFQYLKSLEAMGPKKSGKSQAAGGRSTKSKKVVLMDLNGESDDDNHDDGTMEREKKALEQLERALTKCQLCGPGKFCKISKTGDHVNLTWNQRRAWSIALVCTTLSKNLNILTNFQANKQHSVTISTPPKADIFHMFFPSPSGPVNSTPTPAPAPATPAPGMAPGMMAPLNFMMSPWMMPPFGYPQPNNPFYPPRSPLSCRPHRSQDEMPSSDQPDEELENPYPSITEFLQQLDERHAQRGLSRHFNVFEEKDFYNINEVANITSERLSSEEFGFTSGNAQFFLDAIRKEMKRIDRVVRKGKLHQY